MNILKLVAERAANRPEEATDGVQNQDENEDEEDREAEADSSSTIPLLTSPRPSSLPSNPPTLTIPASAHYSHLPSTTANNHGIPSSPETAIPDQASEAPGPGTEVSPQEAIQSYPTSEFTPQQTRPFVTNLTTSLLSDGSASPERQSRRHTIPSPELGEVNEFSRLTESPSSQLADSPEADDINISSTTIEHASNDSSPELGDVSVPGTWTGSPQSESASISSTMIEHASNDSSPELGDVSVHGAWTGSPLSESASISSTMIEHGSNSSSPELGEVSVPGAWTESASPRYQDSDLEDTPPRGPLVVTNATVSPSSDGSPSSEPRTSQYTVRPASRGVCTANPLTRESTKKAPTGLGIWFLPSISTRRSPFGNSSEEFPPREPHNDSTGESEEAGNPLNDAPELVSPVRFNPLKRGPSIYAIHNNPLEESLAEPDPDVKTLLAGLMVDLGKPVSPKTYWDGPGPVTREDFIEYKTFAENQIKELTTMLYTAAIHRSTAERDLKIAEKSMGAAETLAETTRVRPDRSNRSMSATAPVASVKGKAKEPRLPSRAGERTFEPEASTQAQQLLTSGTGNQLSEININVLLLRAQCWVAMKDWDRVEDFACQGLEAAEEIGFGPIIGRCEFYRGMAHYYRKRWDLALDCFTEARTCIPYCKEGPTVARWIRKAERAIEKSRAMGDSMNNSGMSTPNSDTSSGPKSSAEMSPTKRVTFADRPRAALGENWEPSGSGSGLGMPEVLNRSTADGSRTGPPLGEHRRPSPRSRLGAPERLYRIMTDDSSSEGTRSSAYRTPLSEPEISQPNETQRHVPQWQDRRRLRNQSSGLMAVSREHGTWEQQESFDLPQELPDVVTQLRSDFQSLGLMPRSRGSSSKEDQNAGVSHLESLRSTSESDSPLSPLARMTSINPLEVMRTHAGGFVGAITGAIPWITRPSVRSLPEIPTQQQQDQPGLDNSTSSIHSHEFGKQFL